MAYKGKINLSRSLPVCQPWYYVSITKHLRSKAMKQMNTKARRNIRRESALRRHKLWLKSLQNMFTREVSPKKKIAYHKAIKALEIVIANTKAKLDGTEANKANKAKSSYTIENYLDDINE